MFGKYTDVHVERYETHAVISYRAAGGGWCGIEIDNDERQNWPTVSLQHMACDRLGLPAAAANFIVVIQCSGEKYCIENHGTLFGPRAFMPRDFMRDDEGIVEFVHRLRPLVFAHAKEAFKH